VVAAAAGVVCREVGAVVSSIDFESSRETRERKRRRDNVAQERDEQVARAGLASILRIAGRAIAEAKG
jgi:hypothetical protein